MQEITERKNSEEKLKESEEKFRTIAEQSFLGIAILQNDTVSYVNEQLAYKFGYTTEEIMKWGVGGFMKVIYPDDRKMVAEQAKKKQSGEPDTVNQYQFRGIKKNGNIIWLEIFSKTINYKGKPADFVTIHDITEEKLAGQKLKESEENFRTIAEQAFMGTLIIQNDQVTYVNDALLQIFEFSQDEVNYWKKDNLLKLIHPEDLHYLREYREQLRSGESDIKPYYSYRVFTKYGKIKWIDQFSRPIIYRGKPAELVTIMDITEKKKSRTRISKTQQLKIGAS
ncbi:MAG: hypothetical protein CEE43_04485 [Promethearchaeota archaeon Loki_b32]|nr:MAG: hypothetical protein CEE43_04485 [Candidatus Lokiarchaeota archaeon Loki_b32]